MKNTILFSVVSAALLSMSAAFAGGGSIGGSMFGEAGESDFASNLYLGGSIGQAEARCMLTESDEDCTNDGWKAYAGYKLTDNIAVEAGYYNLGKAEESIEYGSDRIDATGEATGIGLTGVYSYEVIDNLEVFGKAGLMHWNLEGKTTNTVSSRTFKEEQDGNSLLLGVGAAYKFTDNLAVRGEYEHYTAEYQNDLSDSTSTEDSDVGILSGGLTFSTY